MKHWLAHVILAAVCAAIVSSALSYRWARRAEAARRKTAALLTEAEAARRKTAALLTEVRAETWERCAFRECPTTATGWYSGIGWDAEQDELRVCTRHFLLLRGEHAPATPAGDGPGAPGNGDHGSGDSAGRIVGQQLPPWVENILRDHPGPVPLIDADGGGQTPLWACLCGRTLCLAPGTRADCCGPVNDPHGPYGLFPPTADPEAPAAPASPGETP